jgi:hypothetical protein
LFPKRGWGCEVDDYLLIGEIHLLQDLLYTQ